MLRTVALSFAVLLPVGALASDASYYAFAQCGPCEEKEGDLCTDGKPYRYLIAEIHIRSTRRGVCGVFEFNTFVPRRDETGKASCHAFRGAGGSFRGSLQGASAKVTYQSSWQDELASAEIELHPEAVVWRAPNAVDLIPRQARLQRSTEPVPSRVASQLSEVCGRRSLP